MNGNLGRYEETAQLFDYTVTEGIIDNYYLNQTGVEVYNASYYISAPIAIEANTDYTWQFGGTIGHMSPTVGFYDSNDNLISVATHGSGLYFYFTTPSNVAYIKASVYRSVKNEAMLHTGHKLMEYQPYGGVWKDIPYSKLETATDVVTSLPVTVYGDGETDISLLLKGNTETSGNPSPQNPVTVDGVGEETANLFDKDATDTTKGYVDSRYLNPQGDLLTSNSYYVSEYIPVQPNEEYTLVYAETIADAPSVCWYDSSFNHIGGKKYARTVPFTFTTGNNAAYIRFSATKSTKDDAMLNAGSTAIPYEPFGFKISISSNGTPLTPMYFSQPLYKIDTYADDVNSSGTATYKITMQRITQISQSNNFSRAFTVDIPVPAAIQTIYSNIAVGTSSLPDTADRDGKVFINSSKVYIGFGASEDFPIAGSGNPTQAERDVFQAYLQNNEVYVWYVLATPTTESVTIPTITTTGGEVSIDVDTTVKPSELDLTYHGWHSHEPLKRENGQWV